MDSARTIGNLVFGDTNTSSAAGWTLTGNTLTLAGATPSITVNALGGTKTATISAVVAGAAGLAKSGTGTLTLSAANTYLGNTFVDQGTLSIAPIGGLRFSPTSSGVTNSLSGSASATLSVLGTVDLDLSAADTTDGNTWTIVDISSFSGPAPTLTPTAVISTLGAFGETSPGTWELAVTGAKWTFTEAAGILTYTVTATSYQLWANSFTPPIGLPAEDDDNDGVTNQEEFAFGLLPNSGASVNPITAPLSRATGKFSYTRRTGSGLTYSVWFSENLCAWTEDSGATESAIVPSGENETVEVTLSALPGNPLPAKLFVRVLAN